MRAGLVPEMLECPILPNSQQNRSRRVTIGTVIRALRTWRENIAWHGSDDPSIEKAKIGIDFTVYTGS